MAAGDKMFSLYDVIDYEICVPGHLDDSWSDPALTPAVLHRYLKEGQPVTLIAVKADQAGLLGLLRRLYSVGIPLISVARREDDDIRRIK